MKTDNYLVRSKNNKLSCKNAERTNQYLPFQQARMIPGTNLAQTEAQEMEFVDTIQTYIQILILNRL